MWRKKLKKFSPATVIAAAEKGGLKTINFFKKDIFHMKFSKNMFKDFFGIQRHQMII